MFKTPEEGFGLVLVGVTRPSGGSEFRKLKLTFKEEKILAQAGQQQRLARCLEVELHPDCHQDILARIIDRLTEEAPDGRFTTAILLRVLREVAKLVEPAAGGASKDRVIGAWGELYLVLQLMKQVQPGAAQRQAFACWESVAGARDIIDFRFPVGTAVEVKTTLGKRIHRFHDFRQVTVPTDCTQGLVASIRLDEGSAKEGQSCADLVKAILAEFQGSTREKRTFSDEVGQKLELRGFETQDARYFFLAAEDWINFYSMEEIPRPAPAPLVTDVEWTADLSAIAPIEDAQHVLRSFLD